MQTTSHWRQLSLVCQNDRTAVRQNKLQQVRVMDENSLEKNDLSQITDDELRIVIKIEGDGLEGQIDAAIASQILVIQHEIFRIVKIVAFGDEASTRRLPRDIKNKLFVQFKVERGCTEILGEILNPLSAVFSAWGNKMTPEQLLDLSKTIAYLFVGGSLTAGALIWAKEIIVKYLDNKHAQQTSQQSYQHAEAIADKLIECVRSAPNTIVEAAAKNFPTAYKLDYGPQKFNQQQLDEFRGRSPRSKIHDTRKTQSFIILKLNGEKRPTFYAELQEFPDGNTVKATYSQSEDSLFDESEDYVLRAMSLAFAENEPIDLSVVYSSNEAGEIVGVVILGTA